jgi:hypothetical protein
MRTYGVVLSMALWFLTAIASAGEVVTCYRYEFPPSGQAGPPNRICFEMKLLDADVVPLQEMAEKLHAGPPVTNPNGVGGVHWLVNDSLSFGPRPGAGPLDDQADIQVDNPSSVPIYAFAVGLPQTTINTPILPFSQEINPANALIGWQSAILTRYQWNQNAWTAPNTTDTVGNAADDVPPSPPPADWTPPDTSVAGLRFEDLFDGTPGLDMVALFWTVNAQFAIQPGTTRSGFLIGSHGHFLSSQALPFVDLGPGGVIATGNLTVVAEPSGAMLAGVGLAGCGLWHRTRRRQ